MRTLNKSVETFISEEKRYVISFKQDAYTSDQHMYGQFVEEPPVIDWGTGIGDIVHNLRAALDNLVWGLTVKSSGPPPADPIPLGDRWRDIAFPIVTDGSKWPPKKALWGVQNLFGEFETEQPFVTRPDAPEREPLAVLQELSNIDKHRRPHLVMVSATAKGDRYFARPSLGHGMSLFEYRVKRVSSRRPLELHTKSYLATLEPVAGGVSVPITVNVDYKVAVRVAFDEGPPAYGADLINALEKTHQAVSVIITKFESHLPHASD